MKAELPGTFLEAAHYFSDEENCHNFLCALRWPDGHPCCAHCGSANIGKLVVSKRIVPAKMAYGKLRPEHVLTRRVWNCKNCRKQFTAILGSIFQDSPLSLEKWFIGIWTVMNCKNGSSSCEIARTLGISQKSAWHMLHRLRRIVHDDSQDKFAGTVEADETFIGAKARNMHKDKRAEKITGTGPCGKTAVMGLLERSTRNTVSRVRLRVLKTTRKRELQTHVRENVEAGSEVMTDALASYSGLADAFTHQCVDHAMCYVQGKVHTNSLENFWSLPKRSLKGTYVRPSPFHLWRYLDEQAFRFNTRKDTCFDRFASVVANAPGKHLPWKTLTGKDDKPASAASVTFSL